MKEYDRFQKDAANSNKSVAILTKQLEDPPKIAGRYTKICPIHWLMIFPMPGAR
jgi:hypothetical protein